MLRRGIFWTGWILLAVYACIFVYQAYMIQDIPPITIAKWVVLAATVLLIYSARNRDDVIRHHLPH